MKKLNIILALTYITVACSCSSIGPRESVGTGVGTVLGGTLGGVIGNNVGDRRNDVLGAAIGAVIGGAIGNMYGAREDAIDARLAANERASNTLVINVDNSNGSFTPVTLTRAGNMWIGPRGEYYSAVPSHAQLRSVYGF